MSPMEDNSQGRPRQLVASYGLLIAAQLMAIAVLIVMNRFHSLLGESLDLVERQYEESLQYAALGRHIQSYAQESAEMLARGKEIPEREEHARSVQKILGTLAAHNEEVA